MRSLRMRRWLISRLALAITGPAWAGTVDTNPMNNDPEVRAAFKDFYNLDYGGAVKSFDAITLNIPATLRPLRTF